MSRISKSKFILLNVLLFLLPFLYIHLYPTDKFDGEEGWVNYLVYVLTFFLGLLPYIFKYDKISKFKDIENDTKVFITNTLILVVFAFTVINFDMFSFFKFMSFMFLTVGNFIFWVGKYIAILEDENGMQYSTLIQRKHQKWFGLSCIIMGLIFYLISLTSIGSKIPGLAISLIFLWTNGILLKYFVVKTARKEELFD